MIKAPLLLQIAVLALSCIYPSPTQEEAKEVMPSNLVTRVVGILAENQRSGSLIYEGECTSSGEITDSFRIGTPTRGTPAIRALHDAFANEPKLTIKQEASGQIRVTGGNVHTDLLDMRVEQITFRSEDNPRDATAHLVTLPEVKAYLENHRIKLVSASGGIAPMPKGVHLNITLKNTTVSEVLDRIAQSFPGVWIYDECNTASGKRLVDFTFIEF